MQEIIVTKHTNPQGACDCGLCFETRELKGYGVADGVYCNICRKKVIVKDTILIPESIFPELQRSVIKNIFVSCAGSGSVMKWDVN